MNPLDPQPDFLADDCFVRAALGVLALCEQLDAAMLAAPQNEARDALAPDDPLLLATLGLVGLVQQARQAVVGLSQDAPSAPEQVEPAVTAISGELLR